MKRMIGLLCDQFMCLYTHHNIRRFDTDYKIIISHLLDKLYFVQGTLYKSLCSHPMILLYQMLFQ